MRLTNHILFPLKVNGIAGRLSTRGFGFARDGVEDPAFEAERLISIMSYFLAAISS